MSNSIKVGSVDTGPIHAGPFILDIGCEYATIVIPKYGRGAMAIIYEVCTPVHEDAERQRRTALLIQANEQYAKARANPSLWEEVQRERAAWETTNADGLEDW